jgi:aminocarboxymuconate-semialdehyde decarboxylase
MKIDIHNHFYPINFLNQLEKEGGELGLSFETDVWDRKVMLHHGARILTITEPMYTVEKRLEDMDAAGIDVQILTLSAPSVDPFPIEAAARLSRSVNEEIARICQNYPKRFMALATLPYLNPDLTVKELEYCVDELGYKGACIGSNINGIRLDDPILQPFYERMNEYGLPIHIHPRGPVEAQTFKDYRMGPMLGFEVDLCVAVARLLFGGILEKYRNLRFVVSHLGGGIPFLATRINDCYKHYPECQVNVTVEPEEQLRHIYYDTVSFSESSLMCVYNFAGPAQMVLGSDYPHVIGDINRAVTSIESLSIAEAEKEMIFSGNLLALMEHLN